MHPLDREAVKSVGAEGRTAHGLVVARAQHTHGVAPLGKSFAQVKGTPAASAAFRREDIGYQYNFQRAISRRMVSSALQCACQL